MLNKTFSFKSKTIWGFLIFFLALRLIWVCYFPVTNDEAYYWDWSRFLALSYVDAPPFVAWIAFVGSSFFSGALGFRVCVPFLHLASVLFLLLSLREIFSNKLECKSKHALALVFFTELIPVFNMEGFFLLPDAGLLFASSGVLYFLLRSVNQVKNNKSSSALYHSLGVGLFLGIGFLSKYQIAPLALGFVLGFFLACKNNFISFSTALKFQIKYWLWAFIVFLVISSPVLIWNLQNHFASFRFQGQHGFSGFELQTKPLLRYLVGVIFFLFPWYAYLFFKAFKDNLGKYKQYGLFLFPFVFLFLLILISSLGKQALPHWAMPGFFILVPLLAKNIFAFTAKNEIFWRRINIFSLVFSIVVPSLCCFPALQSFTVKKANEFNFQSSDLNLVVFWPHLQKWLQAQNIINSSDTSTHWASLRWYWTAQMGFHLKGQPRVYNFDFTSSSYYQWRDKFEPLAGLHFIILGNRDHFNPKDIEKIMDVSSIEYKNYAEDKNLNLVVVKGVMKNAKTLRAIDKDLESRVRY